MREFSILILPADDLPGVWVSHCLTLGLVSQGNSPLEAKQMIIEAIEIAMADDRENGLDPMDRAPSDRELFDLFDRVVKEGQKVKDVGLNDLPQQQPGRLVIAARFRMATVLPFPKPANPAELPAPWVIAAMANSGNNHRSVG